MIRPIITLMQLNVVNRHWGSVDGKESILKEFAAWMLNSVESIWTFVVGRWVVVLIFCWLLNVDHGDYLFWIDYLIVSIIS